MQAVGVGGISGSFTITFATVKFICQYSYGMGNELFEPQFSYIMEGQDSQMYEIFPRQPTPITTKGRLRADVAFTIRPVIIVGK